MSLAPNVQQERHQIDQSGAFLTSVPILTLLSGRPPTESTLESQTAIHLLGIS